MIQKDKIKSFCEYLNGEYREREKSEDIASGIRSTFIPLANVKQFVDKVHTCKAGKDYLEVWEKDKKTKRVIVTRQGDIYRTDVASINTVPDDLEDISNRNDIMEIAPVKNKDKMLNLFADIVNVKILPAGHHTTDDQSISFADSALEELYKIKSDLKKYA